MRAIGCFNGSNHVGLYLKAELGLSLWYIIKMEEERKARLLRKYMGEAKIKKDSRGREGLMIRDHE